MKVLHFFPVLAFVVCAPLTARAQMQHFVVEAPPLVKKAAEKVAGKENLPAAAQAEESDAEAGYGGGSFTVTAVHDCFSNLGKAETMEIRKNFTNPWQECQHRLKEREKEANAKQVTPDADGKDGKKTEDAPVAAKKEQG